MHYWNIDWVTTDSLLKQADGKILYSTKENVIYVQNKTLEM